MPRTFVTGGSGFIGSALISRLVADGHDVRALVRSAASRQRVASLGAEPVRGELTDPATWQDAAVGSEVIFHLAAETDTDASRARQFEVTVDGTRAALDAARHAGVRRFVLCSSEAALLAGDPLVEVDETAPLRPDSDAAYSAAKAEAELLVIAANSAELETVAIRPRFVWGPRSILIDGLVAAATAGNLPWVDGGHHVTDVTFVDNAVEGLILGWTRGRPGAAYFITDRHRVDFRDFLETLFGIYGVTTAQPEIDTETADRTIPVPTRWFLGQECTLVTDKAVVELGYAAIVGHDAGIDATRAWIASKDRTEPTTA